MDYNIHSPRHGGEGAGGDTEKHLLSYYINLEKKKSSHKKGGGYHFCKINYKFPWKNLRKKLTKGDSPLPDGYVIQGE